MVELFFNKVLYYNKILIYAVIRWM